MATDIPEDAPEAETTEGEGEENSETEEKTEEK